MFFDYEEFKSLAEKENLIVDRNEYGAVYFGDEKTEGEKLLGYLEPSFNYKTMYIKIPKKEQIDLDEFKNTKEMVDYIIKNSKTSVRKSMKESKESDLIDSVATKLRKERNYLKKEFSIKESIKESKIKAITDYREIKVFLDGHTEPSKKYQTYDFNRYGKKYEINGITENKDDVTLTFERGKLKSFTYLGDTENFDKENNATHFSNAMDKGWICEFDNNNDGSNDDEYTITFRLQLFEFM